MTVELRENASRFDVASGDPNVFRVRIIRAGEGSSAFYPAEVIERDGPKVFKPGVFSFANHPSYEEQWDRPERDVTKIVGRQVSESEWSPTDQALYADYRFSDKFVAEVIKPFGDIIGMSIYALGESEFDTIGDYTGAILTKFIEDPLTSVDVVTVAGAGGAIVTKVTEAYKRYNESAPKPPAPKPERATESKHKETGMDEETFVRRLEEGNTKLVDSLVEKLVEALKPAEPETPDAPETSAVTEALIESKLGKTSRARVIESIAAGKTLEEAIEAEKTLAAEILAEAADKAPEVEAPRYGAPVDGVTVGTHKEGWRPGAGFGRRHEEAKS